MKKFTIESFVLIVLVLLAGAVFVYAGDLPTLPPLDGGGIIVSSDPVGPVSPPVTSSDPVDDSVAPALPSLPDSFLVIASPSKPMPATKSVVYYIKEINQKIVNNSFGNASLMEAFKTSIEKAKEKTNLTSSLKTAPGKSIERTDKVYDSTKVSTVVWKDILPIRISTISFPQVKINDDIYTLSLDYRPREEEWLWIFQGVGITINKNGSKMYIDCYEGKLSSALNWRYGQDALTYSFAEGIESCQETSLMNSYLVTAKISNDGEYKRLEVTSPLIPDECDTKIASQNDAINGRILVTCETK